MVKKCFFILLTVVLCSAMSSATPLRREHVPAGAQWVFHADFDMLRSSDIGKLICQDISRDHQDKIDALKQLLGTDLTQDIYAVTLYGSQAGEENASALFYGSFKKDKLLTLLRLNKAYAESTYNGKTLYHWVDDKHGRNQVGAFAADGLIVIGQQVACVTTVLDVLSETTENLSANPEASLHSLTEVSPATFVLAAASGVSDLVQADRHAAILKNSEVMVMMGFEEAGRLNLNINLETESEEAAMQVEQVVVGMMAFASLSQKEKPQLGALLSATTLTRQGREIEFKFECDSDQLYEIMQSFKGKKLHKMAEDLNGSEGEAAGD